MAKVATLTDTFATKDTSKWTWGSGADAISGRAQFAVNSTYSGRLSTTTTYDLTASELIIELVSPPNVGNGSTEAYLQLSSDVPWDNDNYVGFYVTTNKLHCYEKIATVQSLVGTDPTYSATNHRWLRIRESGGTIYWDTSTNGTSWNNHTSKASALVVTSVYVIFAAGYWGTEPTPGTMLLDNIGGGAGAVTHAIKRWNGTAWVNAAALRRWNGSAWVTTPDPATF